MLDKKIINSLFSSKLTKVIAQSLVLIIFLFCFFNFIIQPLRLDFYVIKTVRADTLQKRLALLKKTMEISSLGKYQIRSFFVEQSANSFESLIRKDFPLEDFKDEFDFLIAELKKTIQESPLDYKAYLDLGKIYNVYSRIDSSKVNVSFSELRIEGEKILEQAKKLSPNNQNTYSALIENKFYQKKYQEAISLAEEGLKFEPRFEKFYLIIIQIAKIINDDNLAQEKAKEVLKINPSLETIIEQILNHEL